MIVGVSGKSGSGKSSIGKYLEDRYEYKWIDCDKLAKKIREMHINEIVDLVNDNNILLDNKIDSKKLGGILFNNKLLLQKYNNFIYYELKKELDMLIKKYKNIVVDSMFLPIMDILEKCDYKLLVLCDNEKRKQRILKRDNIEEVYFLKRDSNGLEYTQKDFDFIIDNNDDFQSQIDRIMKTIS